MLGGRSTTRSARRWGLGIPAAMVVRVMVAVGGSAWASTPATSPQKADMAELFKSYNTITGRIGNSWWQSAVALSTLETYQQATGDNSYEIAIPVSFAYYAHSNFENANNDDTGWRGLACLQAYHITRSHLSQAKSYQAISAPHPTHIHHSS